MPTVAGSYIQERRGISAVASALAALGLIWRETPTGDVGIDGHVEYVDPRGLATGRLVALQVKSGLSYFKDRGTSWGFVPDEKHRFYWEHYPLPVLLALHNPDSGVTYWTDARQQLQSPSAIPTKEILLPKEHTLQNCSPESLFAAFGVTGARFLSVPEVLAVLLNRRCANASFPVSYFELFAHGLTNLCRSLYFAMDLACSLADHALDVQDAPGGLGVGLEEHEFLFAYVRFMAEQSIADIQFWDCLIDWHEREMQPRFLAPLTSRGRELVRLVGLWEDRLRATGVSLPDGRVAQEALIQMTQTPSQLQRMHLVRDFEQAMREGASRWAKARD
jgi:hypothetical protein